MYDARRALASASLLVGLFTGGGVVHAESQAPATAASVPSQACRFVLGFDLLRLQLSDFLVGTCQEDQHDAGTGTEEQRTSRGLFAWRKSDNWTAFTDGYRTWINGPFGVQERLNSERFLWERDGETETASSADTTLVAPPSRTAGPAALYSALPAAPWLSTPLEAALFARINADRQGAGLQLAQPDSALLEIARTRAKTQLTLPNLSHNDASGQLAFVGLLEAGGLSYRLAGENLARLTVPVEQAADQAELALMNSPTHRANILAPTFNRLAVGAAVDGRGRIAFAQIFRAL